MGEVPMDWSPQRVVQSFLQQEPQKGFEDLKFEAPSSFQQNTEKKLEKPKLESFLHKNTAPKGLQELKFEQKPLFESPSKALFDFLQAKNWPVQSQEPSQAEFFAQLSRPIEVLGEGAYGKVTKRFHPKTKKEFAVKEMKCHPFQPRLLREIEAQNLQTPGSHVAQINRVGLGGTARDPLIRLAMPVAKYGSLESKLHELHHLSETQLLGIMHQIACGLHSLHTLNLVHMDLKPANILLHTWPPEQKQQQTAVPEIEIADLGLVQWIGSSFPVEPNSLITYVYRPPEMLCLGNNQNFLFTPSGTADIFSAGIVFLQLLSAWIWNLHAQPNYLKMQTVKKGQNVTSELDPIFTALTYFNHFASSSNETWKTLGCDHSRETISRLGHEPTRLGRIQRSEQDRMTLIHNWLLTLMNFGDYFHTKAIRLDGKEEDLRMTRAFVEPLLRLIKQMLSFNPARRPSTETIMNELSKLAKTTLSCNIPQSTDEWKIMNQSLPAIQSKVSLSYASFTNNSKMQDLLKLIVNSFVRVLSGEQYFQTLSPTTRVAQLIETRQKSVSRLLTKALLAVKKFQSEHKVSDNELPIILILYAIWISPLFDASMEHLMCALGSRIEEVTGKSFQEELLRIIEKYKFL